VDLGYARVSTAKQDLDLQLHVLAGIARTTLYRHLPPRPLESLTAAGTPGAPERVE
jgi:hypothetical protein